ncbi:putative toxin-antitoxin system toxin component, PIN family [Metallibacterium sp.]|uniref:putative toxin-antitoxin system toxin component, PIN family n=1 Tax=Metallibacterium sp. TaxID=2940281 RepID=UPI002607D941|nr:putative toxin-antitoxin system toxin component, PIN family [Metallibacterium sp.]
MRVAFDTGTVVSALLFTHGRLAWLRAHWASGACTPLLSAATAAELTRVLAYPKFKLSADEQHELLGDYLPYAEVVARPRRCPILCRDPADRPFLDLAHGGGATVLVSGDADLLSLAGQTAFDIESPPAYRQRVPGR